MAFFGIKKILLTNRGFSLTEVMVGGAVLAGVALTASQLFKDQKVAQRSLTDDQKLTVFHGNLATKMMDPTHCNATMKVLFPSSQPITAKPVTTLYKCTSGCGDQNSTSDLSYDAYTTNAFGGSAFLSVGQLTTLEGGNVRATDKGAAWKVESMSIVNGQNKTGPVTLRINYRNIFNNSKSISKDITLLTRFYQGNFKECLSSKVSSVDNFNNDFCKTFNFSETMVSTEGVMARWDEATQTCKFDGVKDCSSIPGMQADGIGSDGVVKCKSITSPIDAINLQNTAPTTCAPGQKPKAIFIMATKTFGVQCI